MPREKIVPVDNREFDLDLYTITCLKNAFHFDRIMSLSLTLVLYQEIKDPTLLFNNDVIHRKALKSVSFVLNEFYQIVNIETKLTTNWHKRGEVRNEWCIYAKS